ncbi:hypothetical protein Hanom_Chr11g00981401 [Helianthus anomalus]
MREKAISIRTNFKSRIFNKYQNEGKDPTVTHTYLDSEQWKNFLKRRSTEKAQKRSKRAKQCAAKNTCPTHLGRTGWAGFEDKVDGIWSSLEATNKSLQGVKNPFTKKFLSGRAKKNTLTNSYELPPNAIEESKKGNAYIYIHTHL